MLAYRSLHDRAVVSFAGGVGRTSVRRLVEVVDTLVERHFPPCIERVVSHAFSAAATMLSLGGERVAGRGARLAGRVLGGRGGEIGRPQRVATLDRRRAASRPVAGGAGSGASSTRAARNEAAVPMPVTNTAAKLVLRGTDPKTLQPLHERCPLELFETPAERARGRRACAARS